MNCIYILSVLLSLLLLFTIYTLLFLDHFKPINNLKNKHNKLNLTKTETEPDEKNKELSIQEKIIAEIKSHPLILDNNTWSEPIFQHLSSKHLFLTDENCFNNIDKSLCYNTDKILKRTIDNKLLETKKFNN